MHQPTLLSTPGADTLVLCIHGLLGSPRQMAQIARAVQAWGHDALSPLLPGHGGTGRDFAAARAKGWTAHVTGIVAAHRGQYRRVYLVGHSMGGLLALQAASQIPVQGLLLIACPFRLRGPGLRPAKVRLGQLLHPKDHPMKAAYLSGSSVPLSPALLWRGLRPTVELLRLMSETAAILPGIRAPVTAVYSYGDETVSPASWDILRRGLTGTAAEGILLEEACHAYFPAHEGEIVTQALGRMLEA